MKTKDIKVGDRYSAKVSGRLVVVKVLEIVVREGSKWMRGGTTFRCLNEDTQREVRVRSAARFRSPDGPTRERLMQSMADDGPYGRIS